MKIKSVFFISALIILFPIVASAQNPPEQDAIISVERIWDRAQHNAFTGFVRHNGKFYCSFREGSAHVYGINGTIRVITSDDGQNWSSVAHLHEKDVDLRDPKLSVTSDGRIMINIGGSVYKGNTLQSMHPMVSFSDRNGRNFSKPRQIVIDPKIKTDKDWLWRTTWHQGIAWAAVYQVSENGSKIQLVKSIDGITFSYVTTFDLPNGANETTLRFTEDNKMIALVRSDNQNSHGYIGMSGYPYKEWTWNKLEVRLGGPDLLILPNGLMICGTREYPPDRKSKMIVAKISTDGEFRKLITLPSGGDCSYPGMLIRDNILYVSYYSSHEEKTSIYLAKIRLDRINQWLSMGVTPDPYVSQDKDGVVKLACPAKDAEIRYTVDRTIPTQSHGHVYQTPIHISRNTALRIQAYQPGKLNSNVIKTVVGKYIYQDATKIEAALTPGLDYVYYEGKVSRIKDIESLMIIETGVSPQFSIDKRKRNENFAYYFRGYLHIPEDGMYTFYLQSNDGSVLYLDDSVLIDNGGPHGVQEESNEIALRAGKHKIGLKYFQMGGDHELRVFWKRPGFDKTELPDSVLFHILR